jgi:hypothetical protein
MKFCLPGAKRELIAQRELIVYKIFDKKSIFWDVKHFGPSSKNCHFSGNS